MSAGTQVHANLTDEQVREISGDLEEPEWLLEIRLEALDALEDLDMPTSSGRRVRTGRTSMNWTSSPSWTR